jgi:hypothetical protein
VNITPIQGIAPLQQISGKLQDMLDKPDVNYVDNFSFVPRESLVRINIFPPFKVTSLSLFQVSYFIILCHHS